MRKHFRLFFAFIAVLMIFSAAAAAPEDIHLLPLSRYHYYNVDGYGFYDKCADFSWFGIVVHNGTGKDYTISLPKEARVTGWNGTVHPLKNTRYKVMDYGSNNFLRDDRKEIPFSGDLKLPAMSTYAIFMDVGDFSKYNLYWDTDLFFKLQVKDGSQSASISIQGKLAQRGNACPADQVCTAEVLSGNYAANGSGEVIVKVKNNMPDTAEVYGKTDVAITWTDNSGKEQTVTAEDAVLWSTNPGWMSSGTEKTVTGTLKLPVAITASNRKLSLSFHFYHPSSLFFGDFYADTKLSVRSGLQGTVSGSFDTNGKTGTFESTIFNYQDQTVSVTLPAEGQISDGNGGTTAAAISWDSGKALNIPSQGKASLSGKFSFADTRLIHNNASLILSVNVKDSSGNGSGTVAGTVTRNPDPNPVVKASGFCRDLSADGNKLSFTFTLKNESNIDIPLELATTLAIPGQLPNPVISYTGCRSGKASCMSRISGTRFTLEAGETAAFSGEVNLPQKAAATGLTAETSLLYFPDGVRKALYVGKATNSCSASAAPVDTATPVLTKTVPADTATPVPTKTVPADTATPVLTKTVPADTATPVLTKTVPADTATPVPTKTVPADTATPVPTKTVPANTATPVPTKIVPAGTATPEPIPAEPILDAVISAAAYSRCGDSTDFSFTLKITNNGTGEGILDFSDLNLALDREAIRAEFTSCAEMSAGGTTSAACEQMLSAGGFTILPGVTLSLDGVYHPASPIDKDSVLFSLQSDVLIPDYLEYETTSSGSSCQAAVAPIPGDDGKDILTGVSPEKDSVTLTIQLANSGNRDASVTAGSIYLHSAAVSDYQGTVSIDPITGTTTGKDLELIRNGSTFTIPARSIATASVKLNLDLSEGNAESANVSWVFRIENESHTYTGQIRFTQSDPGAPVSPIPAANEPLKFHTLIEPELPDLLPKTGFPTRGTRKPASVQPEHLAYTLLNGLHLQIPVIYADMDLVGIPLDDQNEWAVEWLSDRAGVLESAALPGEGTSIIAAHNHLDMTNAGPFLMLWQLEANDRIFVSDNDGKLLTYSVYANELLDPAAGDSIYKMAVPGSLVLLTCESELPEGGYAYRRAVFAEPLL